MVRVQSWRSSSRMATSVVSAAELAHGLRDAVAQLGGNLVLVAVQPALGDQHLLDARGVLAALRLQPVELGAAGTRSSVA